MTYPKRLIEVDLPIKRISAHARRDASVGPNTPRAEKVLRWILLAGK